MFESKGSKGQKSVERKRTDSY
uniref:Macaca fascicularis brain cDNA clone: QflA-18690, similar to human RAB31, member RAS oncogene family (RAB31), mRNA, RefSeq: NM_006868.2 n=1 Tax=Macaca fascicularis TaxID=9541 RepID=Q25IP8_MACFA|nr:unnamed protein product [Macaca fascicularis]BAE89631.1 unnamed protein product [Macaca fascicularis]